MRWPSLSSLTIGIVALGFSLSGGMAGALTPDDVLFRDLWQTAQARKVLQADPQLGALNVGVKVTNSVAVLWGPIPSAELSFRAEQRLRTMFELIDIRNTLTIEPDDLVGSPPPNVPRSLPDPLPPAAPREQQRPFGEPKIGVALAGIVTPEETLTVRSSPVSRNQPAQAGTLHIPFMGSFQLPR